ncbi:uncharacterized protein DFL_000042 [Arthrobotrys flagrans]|uniref:Uncharacterized protein n=1 Tax=Arthrobotrys flagrans TaxID=97331 RepID=A0A437AD44_ARTFL|nr:hypothetical protein DFL_000042 [Arthrobotrys flagrans]
MSRSAFDRSNIPVVAQNSSSAWLTNEMKVDENGEREVRFADPDIEEAYQNEGDGMNREAFHEYLEVKKTIKPLNIIKRSSMKSDHFENHGTKKISSAEANGACPVTSTTTYQAAQNLLVPSRRTTMRKWVPPGEDIPEGTPDQVREAMLSLESLVRRSEQEFSGLRFPEPKQGLLLHDHEAEARRLLASPKTSPQLFDKVDQIPFVPVARSRVSQLRQGIDNTNMLTNLPAPGALSPNEGQLKHRADDLNVSRTVSGSSKPSNFLLSRHQHGHSASRFGPRSISSNGLTADEFMAVVHRGSSRSRSRPNAIPPPSGATFRGRKHSQESSSIVTDDNTIDLAELSGQTGYPLNSTTVALRSLGHSISTTRRNGIRPRTSGTLSDQHITVAKGRRGRDGEITRWI